MKIVSLVILLAVNIRYSDILEFLLESMSAIILDSPTIRNPIIF